MSPFVFKEQFVRSRPFFLQLLLFALLMGITWSCGDSAGPSGTTTVAVRINAAADPPVAGIDVTSARVLLTRPGGGTVLDTVVALGAGQNPLAQVSSDANLSSVSGESDADSSPTVSVESEASSVAATSIMVLVELVNEVETMMLNLGFLDQSGTSLFQNQPGEVVIRQTGDNNLPPQTVNYVGPGLSAASVEVDLPVPVLFFGNTVMPSAVALDASGDTIPNVPFTWSSPDAGLVTVDPATGEVTPGAGTGQAGLVATVHSTAISGSAAILVRPRPASVVVLSGDGQAGPTGAALPDAIRVQVLDGASQGIEGIPVVFTDAGGGQFSQDAVLTDATGHAEVNWTMGPTGGSQTAAVTVPEVPEISATVTASSYGEAAALTVAGGDQQTGVVGQQLGQQLVVRVIDSGGNPVAGQAVDFAIIAGGGTVVASASETDVQGYVRATWTLGTSTEGSQTVEVQIPAASPSAPWESGMSVVAPIQFTATAVHDQATGLAFTVSPESVDAGAAFTVAVTMVDQYGNAAVTAPSTAVVLAITPGTGVAGATLGGTNPINTASGVATFSNLTIDLVGSGYSLDATASGLTSATSSSFAVVTGGISTIEVTPSAASLTALGETVPFSAVAKDGAGNVVSGVSFTWGSTDEAVATVSAAGVATAVGNGSVQITASAGGVTGSAGLTVSQAVSSIVVTPAVGNIPTIGGTLQFSAEARDANGNALTTQPTFFWASNNQPVATVDASGLATAQAEGSAQITATAGGAVGVANLTVAQTVSSIVVTPAAATLGALGDEQQFAAEARDAGGNPLVTQPVFVWTESSGGAVVTIDGDGLVTAVGNGTSQITASAEGVSGTADVTVSQVMSQIAMEPVAVTLTAVGATQQFTAEAQDANGNAMPTQPTFAWASTNESVATVNSAGLVTTQAEGVTQITASANGFTGSADLTVTQEIVSIVVTPATVTLDAIGAQQQYTAE
ncbi:MAG: Ig-like domain-containing protein, partial [Gemmatimonadota bacterium]